MDAARFTKLSDRCLEDAATALEDFDPDELDFSTSDGVVTFEFADGKRFVLNRQSAASQMWFAAGARAWHYDWDEEEGRWVDDRDRHELFENLARVVSEKLGRPVVFGS
jgi:CyaY protein